MLKFGKVAIPFTRFTLVVPRSWAFLVTLPSFSITIVTWPENPGTPSPASFSAVTSTAKGPDSTTGIADGSIVKARCVAGGGNARGGDAVVDTDGGALATVDHDRVPGRQVRARCRGRCLEHAGSVGRRSAARAVTQEFVEMTAGQNCQHQQVEA